jgi:hypothetical protein
VGYDREAWAFTRSEPQWCIDLRHVELLYELLLAYPFKRVLEVGCYDGASTSALVQAVNDGAGCQLTLCDTHFRPALREVASRCRTPVSLREERSERVIDRSYDLVLIDGDHSIGTVRRELELLLGYQSETVVAHDTRAAEGEFPECDGSRFLGFVLRNHPAYTCLEDALVRPGERTDRGLLLASRNPEVMAAVTPLWQRMRQS